MVLGPFQLVLQNVRSLLLAVVAVVALMGIVNLLLVEQVVGLE
jgi:hypothetical protein